MAIDQINPNLFLRNHVNRWRERQNQLSYSHLISSQTTGMKVDLEFDSTKRSTEFSSDQIDEFDAALVSTKSEHQTTTIPIKNAPIVIKMQPMSKSQSPPPPPVNVLSTRPADLTFEEEKITDCSQNTSRFGFFLRFRKQNFFIFKLFLVKKVVQMEKIILLKKLR